MTDKYVNFNMTMRMADQLVQEFPDELKTSLLVEMVTAAQKVASSHGVQIVGGGTSQARALQTARLLSEDLQSQVDAARDCSCHAAACPQFRYTEEESAQLEAEEAARRAGDGTLSPDG